MKIRDVGLTDALPVRRLEIADVSDVVVIAGPNGVGKSRLIQQLIAHLRSGAANGQFQCVIEATIAAETEQWGKSRLDLSDATDAGTFARTLQASRRRRNLRSSLINFESDRTVQNIQPLQFQWDMPDPEEEDMVWDVTFGFMRDRFQDTVHSMFRMIETQKQSIATRAVTLRRDGHNSMALNFEDPMQPFKDVFSRLLGPKELVDPSARAQRLEFRHEGATYDFTALSSGEREVVNIAFDFLLRKPEDCIIFFDEPELHLHPELSYRLIQTLQEIGARNQFVFSTHSPDIITASLDRTVIFLSPAATSDTGQPVNQAILVTEADETNQALHLLGQSVGIVALGRRIVLIEGTESSIDKQTYGSILQQRHPGLVLVPSGGKHLIESFDQVYEHVLNRSIWGVDFFMLCDGDGTPRSSATEDVAKSEGRLRLLPRYHIENYFLDAKVWVDAFRSLESSGSWLLDDKRIDEKLRELALATLPYGVALAVSRRLRMQVGNIDVMVKGAHSMSTDELSAAILQRANAERSRSAEALGDDAVAVVVQAEFDRASTALAADSEDWMVVLPGKPIFRAFAKAAGIQPGRAKTLYTAAGLASERVPFLDVIEIFDDFAAV